MAGVHGVGKGYFGAPVASELGLIHLTASQLIREERGSATWGADKKVTGVEDNQLALIRAVERRRILDQNVLLDGHFVLRDSQGTLVSLNESVFHQLNLAGVILLTEDANTIFSRLVQRDGAGQKLAEITSLAAAESKHASTVCRALGLPLLELYAPTKSTVLHAVSSLLEIQNSPQSRKENHPK